MRIFLIVLTFGFLLVPAIADAQGLKNRKMPKPIMPKQTYRPGSSISGSIGPALRPPTSMHLSSHFLLPGSGITARIGHFSPPQSIIPGYGTLRLSPLYSSEERWPYMPGVPSFDPLEHLLEELLNPPGILEGMRSSSPFMPSSTQQLLGQILAFDSPGHLNLLEQPFFRNRGRHVPGLGGLTGMNGLNLGFPSAPVFGNIATPHFRHMGLHGAHFPSNHLLLHHQLPFMPGSFGFSPYGGGRTGWPQISPFGFPTNPLMRGAPLNPRMRSPYGPRILAPSAKAPPPAPVAPPAEAQRAFLKQFEKDLAQIVELARTKKWPELKKSIRPVLNLPDLPKVLTTNLKTLDGMATEMENVARLQAVTEKLASLNRGNGPTKAGLPGLMNWGTILAPAYADHLECRVVDVQVCAADIDQFRSLVARIAAGPLPANKDVRATPIAVEKLLGRELSGVEALVYLQMVGDRRGVEEIAAVLRK